MGPVPGRDASLAQAQHLLNNWFIYGETCLAQNLEENNPSRLGAAAQRCKSFLSCERIKLSLTPRLQGLVGGVFF